VLTIKKIIRLVVFSVLVFSFFSQKFFSHASELFDTSLRSNYAVDDVGNTSVTHTIGITNKSPTTFIKQYALKTTATQLHNIRVEYNNKPLSAHVVATDDGTSIAIDFPDEVVGEGKTREFKIIYTDADIATIGGSVLELNIPASSDLATFNSQLITINTPVKFGVPVRTNPNPTSITPRGSSIETVYASSLGKPISLLFGKEQLYDTKIIYSLENSTTSGGIAQIALPPDTSFQRVYYQSLDPLPESLTTDEDGNWIATYKVDPKTTLTVNLLVSFKITLTPNSIPVLSPLPAHVASQEFWEISNSLIVEKSAQLGSAGAIFEFVTNNLNYSQQLITEPPVRLGAVAALQNPDQAVCQEFSDLFITLARSQNIPARRLTGYAYTQDNKTRPLSLEDDILHAWPEYYSYQENLWRPVDPTWTDTTGGVDYFNQFDLNHLVFAINGVSSTSPVSASDIDVKFGTGFPEDKVTPAVALSQQKLIGVPIPGRYSIAITNHTGLAIYELSILIDNRVVHQVSELLPFQSVSVALPVIENTSNLPQLSVSTVTIQDGEHTIIYENTNLKLLSTPTNFIGLGIGFAFITLATGSVLVLKRQKRGHLRR
jgi:transglutaminase-like putative cysteine protease